jgi:hypothetical protein
MRPLAAPLPYAGPRGEVPLVGSKAAGVGAACPRASVVARLPSELAISAPDWRPNWELPPS